MRYTKLNKKCNKPQICREKQAQHEAHIRKQKNEADYNNEVKGHHTNHEENILNKIHERQGDFSARFPITLKYSFKDFNAVKKSLECQV